VLTEHHIARRNEQLPPVNEELLLDYVLAANGVFTRGRRPGMEVCLPVEPDVRIRGLRDIAPYVQWGYPRVSAEILALIFTVSQTIAKKEPREALFYLRFSATEDGGPTTVMPSPNPFQRERNCEGHLLCREGWHLLFPEQRGTEHRVEPLQRGPGTAEADALIEVHSHHAMEAHFSPDDDEDEGGGMSFRVYGVIGTIFLSPAIRTRVGLFGHLHEYPASEFFELPEGVIDCVDFQPRINADRQGV